MWGHVIFGWRDKVAARKNVTLSEVRSLFDIVIENFPSTKPRLSNDANIIDNKSFESTFFKIKLFRAAN